MRSDEQLPSNNEPSTSNRHRRSKLFRKVLFFSVVLLVLIGSFAAIISSIFRNLDRRIIELTSTERNDNYRQTWREDNITVRIDNINNITDVSDEIREIKSRLIDQNDEISKLHELVYYKFDTAVKALNETVEEVQKNVNQQVEEVNENVSSQNSWMAYQFAGTFAILGSLISFWHMTAHIRKMSEPTVQRKIIAIMWMVPIYTVSSWLGLVFVKAQAYLGILKDFYESYAIYTFLSFLIAILGRGDRNAVIDLLAQHKDHLKTPLRLRPWKPLDFATTRHKAEAVLDQCMLFTLQFVLLRPITTIALVVSDSFHESRWDWKYPQFYVMMIVNVSIAFAFTGLLRFYHVVKSDLSWCNPFSKFLCIKGVVFMTFWQGIVISFIAHAVYRQEDDIDRDKNATEWAKEAQSFLVCLEMFLFAIVHCFVFPTDEWQPGYQEKAKRRIRATFGDSLALKDFVNDVKLVMRSKRKRRAQKKANGNNYEDANGSTIMADDDLELDIDWSQGWGRIEQYIDLVESEEALQENDISAKRIDDLGDLEMREEKEMDKRDEREVI